MARRCSLMVSSDNQGGFLVMVSIVISLCSATAVESYALRGSACPSPPTHHPPYLSFASQVV